MNKNRTVLQEESLCRNDKASRPPVVIQTGPCGTLVFEDIHIFSLVQMVQTAFVLEQQKKHATSSFLCERQATKK